MSVRELIAEEKCFLGIEFGSTRVKAVLCDESSQPVASGAHEWENRLENGVWTYSQEDIITALQSCYADLKRDVRERFSVTLTGFAGMGISAMMHGYLAFDEADRLLVPFRTWRNTMTAGAAEKLTALFGFNIPQRWSIAHLYQAMLNGEPHVKQIAHLNTLAGYVHFLLTGRRVLGVGDASGMFPVEGGCRYNSEMMKSFSALPEAAACGRELRDMLPVIAAAGEECGRLTERGAVLLDPEGDLKAGVPLCPPEGDAGTGMTATNSVRAGTGNISAGTSVFSMLVLERELSGCYPEIDVVTTPDGAPVAMVHCNNCCGELDYWVKLFEQFAELSGSRLDRGSIYELLYRNAMTAPADCGGVTACNFISGEPVAGVAEGRPMYMRSPDSRADLGAFVRAELYASLAALKLGNDILFEKEKMTAKRFNCHGGLFKVKGAAAQIAADGLGTPTAVAASAGEGGAWGMALLAQYMVTGGGLSLADWLESRVFAGLEAEEYSPDEQGSRGFAEYMKNYRIVLEAERTMKAQKEKQDA